MVICYVPLLIYFVRSGYVHPNGPYLANTGTYGYYWSSTPHSSGTPAYYLDIYPASNGSVAPSHNAHRLLGLSLRCLARELRVDGEKLYFVRSGIVYPHITSDPYRATGSNAFYWSSTPHSNDTIAYDLAFHASGVSPSHNSSRYTAFSLRCLARELRVDEDGDEVKKGMKKP